MTTQTAQLSPPTNHVFVDFENVHEVDLSIIGAKSVTLTLLLGAQQTKVDAALVEKLMEHAASVHLVRLTKNGNNALDFTLAYYVGRAALTDPAGFFHIISKDTGYDALVEHLRSRHIRAHRHDNFTTLTFSGPPKPPPAGAGAPDLLTRAVEHLGKNTKNRPKRKETLMRHLLSLSGNAASESEIQNLIERLCQKGQVSIGDKGAIRYHG